MFRIKKKFSHIVFILGSTAIALTMIRKHESKLFVQNWRGQMRSSEVSQCGGHDSISEVSQQRGKCGTKLGLSEACFSSKLSGLKSSYLLSHICLNFTP